MPSREFAIELEGVVKRFDDIVALDNVLFKVRDGEYICVIGPSGSGKSTLLKAIAGLVKIDEGKIYLFGERADILPIERRDISLVFQDILLFPHMDVASNIAYPLEVKGEENVYGKMREIASAFSVEDSLHSFPSELSMGVQQKTAIARAVASGSKILLMDEPYGSIDPVTSLKLRHEVKLLAKMLGLTIVHVTHNQEEALSVADRIVLLRKGRLEQIGSPLELYFNPAKPFVARFIGGETNFFTGSVVRREGSLLEIKTEIGVVRAFGAPKNDKVVVSVRPEYIMFADEGFEGRVVLREFLAGYYRYVVDVNGFRVVVKSFKRVGVGEDVFLFFVPERIVVFDYPEEGLEEAVRYE